MRGGLATGWFLNGVALFESGLDPHALLSFCRALEVEAGRRRGKHWGDRPLDLDLLIVEQQVIDDYELKIPHPGISSRSFVLRPLGEVWPDAIEPTSGKRYRDLPPAPGPRAIPIGVVASPSRELYE